MGRPRASLSRRELLAALLGAPLAAEACRFLPSRRIDGAIRGASMELGHRLRDATGAQSCIVCFRPLTSNAGATQPPAKRAFASEANANPSGVTA